MSGNTIDVKSGVSGRYKIEAGQYNVGGRFEPTKETGWFDNLITDIGLEKMHDSGYLGQCYVGSGSATPTNGDNAMESLIAATTNRLSTDRTAQSSEPYYTTITIVFEFDEGAAAGNIAEVGIGWSSTSDSALYSRALVLDSEGNPTTITVLSNEYLRVTYQLRVYPDTTAFNGTIEINGTNHDYTVLPLNVDDTASSSGWGMTNTGSSSGSVMTVLSRATNNNTLPLVTDSTVSGSSDTVDAVSALPYVENSLYQDVELFWGLNSANFSEGIGGMYYVAGWTYWGAVFTPHIPKTDQETLTMVFRFSWGRK